MGFATYLMEESGERILSVIALGASLLAVGYSRRALSMKGADHRRAEAVRRGGTLIVAKTFLKADINPKSPAQVAVCIRNNCGEHLPIEGIGFRPVNGFRRWLPVVPLRIDSNGREMMALRPDQRFDWYFTTADVARVPREGSRGGIACRRLHCGIGTSAL